MGNNISEGLVYPHLYVNSIYIADRFDTLARYNAYNKFKILPSANEINVLSRYKMTSRIYCDQQMTETDSAREAMSDSLFENVDGHGEIAAIYLRALPGKSPHQIPVVVRIGSGHHVSSVDVASYTSPPKYSPSRIASDASMNRRTCLSALSSESLHCVCRTHRQQTVCE